MSARTRWITFDCFGTLVDWQSGFEAALRPVVGDRTGDVLRAYHARERLIERERPHRSYKDVLATSLARAAADCGVTLPESGRTTLVDAWPHMPVFEDVEPMLAQLRLRGWRLAVLTNCDEDLFAITHRRFSRPFDLVLTAERVRGYKPAPWHFQAFERLTRVDRRDWVHIACSWYHDIAPAQALGISNVWLDRERTEAGAATSVHVYSAVDVPQVRVPAHVLEAPACC